MSKYLNTVIALLAFASVAMAGSFGFGTNRNIAAMSYKITNVNYYASAIYYGTNLVAAWGISPSLDLPDSYCWRHFKLNDNADSVYVEDSGYYNQSAASTVNTSSMHADGKVGGALTFNGPYVSVDQSGFSVEGAFTFTAWVYLDNSAPYMRVCSVGGGWSWYRQGSPYGMTLYVGDGANNAVSMQPLPVDSSWHFIAIVSDASGNYSMFLDGDKTVVASATAVNGAGSFYIGDDPTSSYPVKGAMDDVRIYTKALTSSEIAFIYSSGAGTELNLPTQ